MHQQTIREVLVTVNMHIGNFRHKIDVSFEFGKLANEDELAASILAEKKQYRQACYFLIQSMEKSIRSKIFTLVNPKLEYFRNKNRSHSLDSAVEFLIEIISTDKTIQEQVSKQLNEHVLKNTKYGHLHNNLRYPSFSEKYDSYSVLDMTENDFIALKERLFLLKVFLSDLHRIT